MRRLSAATVLVAATCGVISPAVPAGASVPAPAAAVSRAHYVGVHHARQLIVVSASRRHVTRATVRAFARGAHGWRLVHGPWPAWIGRSGFAARGGKREGDGRTPTGSFRISYFFGAGPRPDVRFRWRHAARTSFWDDDPASPRYNLWVDSRRASPGRDPEPLQVRPSYDAAAVVAYNPSRTPGRGSWIFLHITHHSPTSGCVALPRHRLLVLLRWLRPHDRPRVIMGSRADITH